MRTIIYVSLFLLAGCASTTALPQTKANISTRDFAKCVSSPDRAICYLRLANKTGDLPSATVERLASNPALMEAIGLDGIAGPSPVKPKEETPPWTDRVFNEPDRIVWSAGTDALAMDAEGVPPQEALRPLLAANANLQSLSIYLGQITTQSAVEKRIRQYRRFLDLYFDADEDGNGSAPSLEFVRAALASWDVDLSGEVQTYTDFDQDKSRRELASAYARIGDKQAARRIFETTRIDPSKIDLKIAISSGDLESAWALTVATIKSPSNEVGSAILSATLNDIPQLAFETGNTHLLSKIEQQLSDESFVARVSPHSLFPSLKYLSQKIIEPVTRSLERRQHDAHVPYWYLAKLWMVSGREVELDNVIEPLSTAVSGCRTRSGCLESRKLLELLAIRGRMNEAYTLVGVEASDVLFDVNPYPPFDEEMRFGEGPLKSLDLLLSRHLAKGSYLSLEGALRNCVYQRLSKKRVVALASEPDFDGAYSCATKLIEVSELPGSIKAYQARYENTLDGMKVNYEYGRHVAAFTALSLANALADTDADRSKFLEDEALRLLASAPKRNAYGLFVPLALKRLEIAGRL